MVADKPIGLTFLDGLGATDAQVSYVESFGGQPAWKEHFSLVLFFWIDPWWEPLKEGLSLNTSYLVECMLTVDLRLETCFTIDS